jgi:hypothetical protein
MQHRAEDEHRKKAPNTKSCLAHAKSLGIFLGYNGKRASDYKSMDQGQNCAQMQFV